MSKLKKIGNSIGVIIPAKFLRNVNKSADIAMSIEDNVITLTFEKRQKSLKELIDEKRIRNRRIMQKKGYNPFKVKIIK